MGNEGHLSILKQRVEAWNRWGKENPKFSASRELKEFPKTGVLHLVS